MSHGDRHALHQLTGIKASSGNAYIVAVANAGDNYGMSSLGEAQDGRRTNLLDLLREADTFEKYKSIAVALRSPSIVEYTDANVVMTGRKWYFHNPSLQYCIKSTRRYGKPL